jgi:glyoxylase-like metal-dependent hydrolase (beta-lactamase superfamily II)
LTQHSLTPELVINTHGHYDHIGCDDKFGVKVCAHANDEGMLKDPRQNLSSFFALSYKVGSEIELLKDGQIIEAAGVSLKVLHIPGHTQGGIALVLEKPEKGVVFTGDNLFCQGIGRSDLAGGNEAQLIKAIKEKLLTLPDETIVYPGHGPSSTIGEEKKHNPYLGD